ncbi:L-lactate permease [Adhaeribacter rhizoryzae]|uniref:L-lactate permease n=1 Tax=Adhaeribacter rhizoryzae TaxID=2607907 RepID=A0A5M6D7H3_9BACT|nr:L-lactate permease [Adhaeribacter rhizoryzae]KAA5543457.1 L-lactate permease [Adhaeribacter rhizoryzae]
MVYFLSVLPILVLIILSLTKGVKEAVYAGLLVTLVLFFYWGASFSHFLGTLGVSLMTTINILMIVFGAAFLYNIMDKTGLINGISHSLDNLETTKELKFFLLAIGLTALFEGVAGFGTPGAIVPLLLISLGFNAILSVSVVLLFDGLFSMFGAVGTPLLTGLQIPLQLPGATVQNIAILSAVAGVMVIAVLLLFVFRLFAQYNIPVKDKKQVLVLYSFFALPFCALAYFVPELATVLAALIMLVLSVLYFKGYQRNLHLQYWVPYAALAFLLLLPKLFNPLHRWIGWDISFNNMFGSNIDASLKPMQSPLIPFIIVGLGVAFFTKTQSFYLKDTFGKIITVLIVLFPSIAVAQLMLNSGVSQPSMVNYISEMLARLGNFYPICAPFIGITGSFITGSTTISNVVFGPSQLVTGESLNMPPASVLALQLSGASMGNAICLFNIIAAASIANIKNYKSVLAHNIVPTLLGGLLFGLLGWLFISFF